MNTKHCLSTGKPRVQEQKLFTFYTLVYRMKERRLLINVPSRKPAKSSLQWRLGRCLPVLPHGATK